MRRRLLYILFICTLYSVLCTPVRAIEVPCGTWIELRANAIEGWHFERWDDGDTSAVRQIEVLSDLNFVAYFVPDCQVGPTLSVVSLYDWLLMLDMRSIEEQGYFFNPDDVSWYRVNGLPDKLEDGASGDDEMLANGYYLTIDKSFVGTGDYYAVADLSGTASGELCSNLIRSNIVSYSSAVSAPKQAPVLEPTIVRPYEMQRLLRLDPNYPTTVTIYNIAGHRLQTLSADGVERMSLQAEGADGCYQIVVQNGEEYYVLRYIVVR